MNSSKTNAISRSVLKSWKKKFKDNEILNKKNVFYENVFL